MINVKAMEEAARKLAAADEKFKPLVYPFHGTTDMRGEYALCYLIVCPEYQEELLRLGLEREFCVMQAMGLGWLATPVRGHLATQLDVAGSGAATRPRKGGRLSVR